MEKLNFVPRGVRSIREEKKAAVLREERRKTAEHVRGSLKLLPFFELRDLLVGFHQLDSERAISVTKETKNKLMDLINTHLPRDVYVAVLAAHHLDIHRLRKEEELSPGLCKRLLDELDILISQWQDVEEGLAQAE